MQIYWKHIADATAVATVLFTSLGLAPLCSAQQRAAALELISPSITVSLDGQLHRRVSWRESQGAGILAADPAVQEGIKINGRWLVDFPIDASSVGREVVEDPDFGPLQKGAATGIAVDEESGVRMERHVEILLPTRFPNVVITRSRYRNAGRHTIHIGAVYSQRLLLDRRLAEPAAQPYDFASFQGGAYHWGDDYSLIRLHPGFSQTNFQGLDYVFGAEGEGGGMPFVDLWSKTMGVAIAHLSPRPEWVSLPVRVRDDGCVEIAIEENPLKKFAQPEYLAPGETYETLTTAVIFHHLDYFDALSTYGELLRARGVDIPRTSPPSAYAPYWKSWGFRFDFNPERMLKLLPELASMGIRIANVDDGWFDWYGDWQPNRDPSKFPGGGAQVASFVRKVHAQGFKTNLWWYPLGVSPESTLAQEHPELLVQGEDGEYPVDSRHLYQLCPAYAPALRHIEKTLERFISEWGFDGVYVDTDGLSAVPACFNPAHHHASPLDSFRAMPAVYRTVHDTLLRLKPDPYLEVCICAMPHSPYYMPYYFIANASDPVNPAQARRRIKLEKAIRGPRFDVGDCYQVPLNEWDGYSLPESFPSAMGTGAQMTTFYGQLNPDQLSRWRHWFGLYRELELSSGEYLNLYDIAFDNPEIHVIRKGRELFYGIFAALWASSRPIELRGLDPAATYRVINYATGRELGQVGGAEPVFRTGFKNSLLLRLSPIDK